MSDPQAPAIETTATTLQGQLLELAIALKVKQKTIPVQLNKVDIDNDLVTGRISLQIEFPAIIELNGEQIVITATDVPEGFLEAGG